MSKMLALNIQQLPGGGYMLAYTMDSGAQMQAYSACSTLAEVFHRCVLPMAQQQFAEQPLTYQAPHQAPLPPVDDGTLPRIATGPVRHGAPANSSLTAALDGVRAGSVNIITPLLIAAVWFGSRTWGLV